MKEPRYRKLADLLTAYSTALKKGDRVWIDASETHSAEALYRKPLGRYLVESGLLSQSQLDIALRDQQYSGYALGEILVLRGWIQQSVTYIVTGKQIGRAHV